jgi:hypothetical protein
MAAGRALFVKVTKGQTGMLLDAEIRNILSGWRVGGYGKPRRTGP